MGKNVHMDRVIPVFPTTYFGSIQYFKELAQYDQVIIESKSHYLKQTYRNRCDIPSANGVLSLSIPVERPNGSKTVIDQVLVSDDENWRARHWRSIKSAYQSAPFFDYYGMEVEELLQQEEMNILKFNQVILERMVQWLDLSIDFSFSDDFFPPIQNDPRDILVCKQKSPIYTKAPYIQVFPSEEGYNERISMLDAIMCIGPMAHNLIIST